MSANGKWPQRPHDVVLMGLRRSPASVDSIEVPTPHMLELFNCTDADAELPSIIGWYARRMPGWAIARRRGEFGSDSVVFARMDEPKKDWPAGVRDE